MGVSTYLEFITVLFGWVMYDRLWAVLSDTGIVYAPFVVIVVSNIIDSRKGGDDEGSAAIQSLKRNETDLVVAVAVMFFAAVPFQDVRLGEMSYVRPALDCGTAQRIADGREPGVVTGLSTGTSYDATLATLGGETGRIPLWWGFMHMASKAVVSAASAAVPCSHDVAGIPTRLGNDAIEDQELLREMADFKLDCHMASLSCLERRHCVPGSRMRDAVDKDWMGSRYFVETAGFYDRYYSREERPAFPVRAARDDGLAGAHPTCREWWTDGANGLRARLLGEIDAGTRNELLYDPGAVFRTENPAASTAELEDMLLRKYLASRVSGLGSTLSYEPGLGEVYRSEEGGVRGVVAATGDFLDDVSSGTLAGVGALLRAPGAAAAGTAIRDGMPMFLSLLLMVFVAVLPVLMVFSRYEPGTLIVLSLVFFGLQFVYVLWGIAFWVDQHLFSALTGPASAPKVNPMAGVILLWSQRLLYVAFPMIWLAGLGWVGVRASEAFAGGVGTPGQSAAKMAESGGEAVSGTVTSAGRGVATRALKG